MTAREQTQALVERVKAGEEGLMPELWESVKGLVAWYAARVAPKLPPSIGLTFDDLYSSGYLALADAVEHYDGEHNKPDGNNSGNFIALFMFYLRKAFAEAPGVRRSNDPLRNPFTRSLDEPLGEDDDYTLCDTVADPHNGFEDAEYRIYTEQLHKALETAINSLDDVEAATIRSRFYEERTQKEVSEALGVSPSYAQQIEVKALRKLRSPKLSRPLREFIEERTPYYMHIGVSQFNSTSTSAPELITILREEWTQRYSELRSRE